MSIQERVLALLRQYRRTPWGLQTSARKDERNPNIPEEVAELRGQIAELNARIDALLASHRRFAGAVSTEHRAPSGPEGVVHLQPKATAMAAEEDSAVHSLGLAFEERFRGSQEEIAARLRPYLDYLREHDAFASGRPFLDIGCGRGDWLQLLSDTNAAYGIDTNSIAVDAAVQRGLDARHEDALAHLFGLPDNALGVITLFHVAEHLSPERLIALIGEVHRTLVTKGIVILETPNPENIRVGAWTFYNDITHRHPIPPQLGQFLLESRGFVNVEVRRLHPYPEDHRIQENSETTRRLNDLIYGPQDYALVAIKA